MKLFLYCTYHLLFMRDLSDTRMRIRYNNIQCGVEGQNHTNGVPALTARRYNVNQGSRNTPHILSQTCRSLSNVYSDRDLVYSFQADDKRLRASRCSHIRARYFKAFRYDIHPLSRLATGSDTLMASSSLRTAVTSLVAPRILETNWEISTVSFIMVLNAPRTSKVIG